MKDTTLTPAHYQLYLKELFEWATLPGRPLGADMTYVKTIYQKLQTALPHENPPLAETRFDYQLDWNVEADVPMIDFVCAFTDFLEAHGWCGGGITRPQDPIDESEVTNTNDNR